VLRTLETPSVKCLYICWAGAAGFHANTWHQLLVKYSSNSTDHIGTALHFASDYRNTPYQVPLQSLPAFIRLFNVLRWSSRSQNLQLKQKQLGVSLETEPTY